jgi:hypothetical protein
MPAGLRKKRFHMRSQMNRGETVKKENSIRRFGLPRLMRWVLLLMLGCGAAAMEKPDVPVVDGHLGMCSANFVVRNNEQKPVYNATINVVIRHGLLGLHRMELQVSTNSDGEARVAGLPEKTKNPLKFRVASGELTKTVFHDPSAKCDATIDVNLGAQ